MDRIRFSLSVSHDPPLSTKTAEESCAEKRRRRRSAADSEFPCLVSRFVHLHIGCHSSRSQAVLPIHFPAIRSLAPVLYYYLNDQEEEQVRQKLDGTPVLASGRTNYIPSAIIIGQAVMEAGGCGRVAVRVNDVWRQVQAQYGDPRDGTSLKVPG
jgi:hypothetical protein